MSAFISRSNMPHTISVENVYTAVESGLLWNLMRKEKETARVQAKTF